MEQHNGVNAFYAKTRNNWRQWLQKNHEKENCVWLIMYKKQTGIASIYYPEAVQEALCFGWIDSKPNKRDDDSFYQFFTKRKPKSNWSKINKDSVKILLTKNLIAPAGLKMIELAKQTGTWEALEVVDAMEIPNDLQKMFNTNKTAYEFWEKFPPSAKKGILQWILSAKLPETRLKRITETVNLAEKNVRANQYVKK